MLRIGQLLVVCVVAIGASAACATTNRQTPAAAPVDKPVRSVAAAAVSHRPWRPLHKGGADISTGVYTREDDDLVVNTPLPIVLRRTTTRAMPTRDSSVSTQRIRASGGSTVTATRAFRGAI